MLDYFKGRMVHEDGQVMVEYALLLALLTAVSVATLTILGFRIGNAFQTIVNALP